MTHGITVTAALNARLRTLGDVMARLQAVEASATSAAASTRLERLGALGLAVTGK
jgi:hypothetical protein